MARTLFGFLLGLSLGWAVPATAANEVAGGKDAIASAPQKTLAMLAIPQPIDNQVSISALVDQFDDVVFGQEHGQMAQIIRRWGVAPTVAVFTAPSFKGSPPFAAIRNHLDSIGALTGLSMTQTADFSAATLRLGYYPREDFAKLPAAPNTDPAQYARFVKKSACLGLAAGADDHPGTLQRGAILIGADIDETLQQHCLLEELVQVMGLPNDACHYRPSLFCEADHVFALTREDRILLKTLYDHRLTNGMSREEAMPIARAIITELIIDY